MIYASDSNVEMFEKKKTQTTTLILNGELLL